MGLCHHSGPFILPVVGHVEGQYFSKSGKISKIRCGEECVRQESYGMGLNSSQSGGGGGGGDDAKYQ